MPDVAAPSQGPPGVRLLSWRDASGEMCLNFHPGQLRAWDSQARVVLVLAGAQSGKTSFGPFWLAREIQRKGPGDYIVAAPTYKLLSLKLFPEFLRLFKVACRWGDFTGRGGKRLFIAGEVLEALRDRAGPAVPGGADHA